MVNQYILLAYYFMWSLLVFTTICFLVSGLDDLFFDIYYWSYMAWRAWILRKGKELSYEKFYDLPQQRIAIMVACWHEAGVIEMMLKHNVYSIEYDNYDIFVGVYSNDPTTVAAVQGVADKMPKVKCVIGPDPGPTNKARNLNAIYSYIMEYEKENNIEYDIFVLHDSEDIIHPLSFKIYNGLMPKNAMVQLPVFPLPVGLWKLTHWIYAAEFSESHTKDMVVREHIGGLVPSAGVGTGFSRQALDLLKNERGGVPFATNTLTEDYSTALQIRRNGLREIFVLQYVYRTVWRKRWFLFGEIRPYVVKEYIATREMFPAEYMKSVRQKARWVLGIAFEEWINTGWGGNIATVYTLMHDRKSLFTHFITGLFFLVLPFWIIYGFYISGRPEYPTLQDEFEKHLWVWHTILFSSFLMVVRLVERMIAVYRVYGFFPAIMSGPLILYGNVINLHALFRAYSQFIYTPPSKGGGTKWDKTDHEFPAAKQLLPYKFKLGELFINKGWLTKQELRKIQKIQLATGEKFGDLLIRLKYITPEQLFEGIAEQFGLPIIDKKDIKPLNFSAIPGISHFNYDRIIHEHCFPVSIDKQTMSIAIHDPSNELLLAAITEWIKPYKPQFLLIK